MSARPCPFCGGYNQTVSCRRSGGDRYHLIGQVRCLDCGARGPTAAGGHVMDWRMRPGKAEVDALEARAAALWDGRGDDETDTNGMPLWGWENKK